VGPFEEFGELAAERVGGHFIKDGAWPGWRL
jgi:hypothetical protein